MNQTGSLLYRTAAVVLLLTGTAAIVLAFFNEPVALQVALGVIGAGLLVLSLVPLNLARLEKKADTRFDELIAKLDEIREELRKLEEKPEKGGIAIADIFSSGMKWYSDYASKKDDEEKKEE